MKQLASRKSMVKFGNEKVKYELSKEKLSDFENKAKRLRKQDSRERKKWHKKLGKQTEETDD